MPSLTAFIQFINGIETAELTSNAAESPRTFEEWMDFFSDWQPTPSSVNSSKELRVVAVPASELPKLTYDYEGYEGDALADSEAIWD